MLRGVCLDLDTFISYDVEKYNRFIKVTVSLNKTIYARTTEFNRFYIP